MRTSRLNSAVSTFRSCSGRFSLVLAKGGDRPLHSLYERCRVNSQQYKQQRQGGKRNRVGKGE